MPRNRRRNIGIAFVFVAVAATFAWTRVRSHAPPLAEALEMIASIRTAEESYRTEMGTYLNVSTALAANQRTNHFALYPQAPREPGPDAVPWGGDCPSSACNTSSTWTMLPVRAVGRVRFGYSVIAGRAGERPTAVVTLDGVPVTWPVPQDDWYIITAVGDVKGTGVFTTVLATSFDDSIRRDGPER